MVQMLEGGSGKSNGKKNLVLCETKNSTSGIKSVTVQKSKKSSLELYRIIWS